ncbi:hypothetical protein ACP4OV_030683 [Aristida adscensionis]
MAGRDHVVIFPLMTRSHTLPLLHFATALSVHHKGLRATVITTPANLAFVRSRLPTSVDTVVLPFPSLPSLPAGLESKDGLPSMSLFPDFLRATALMREPFAEFLASLPSPPLVVISDFFLGFTHGVASDAGVRRMVYHGMSCFSTAISMTVRANPPAGAEDGALFHVPGMPEDVTIVAGDLPYDLSKMGDPENPMARFYIDEIGNSHVRSWGLLVNSFAALDEDYVAPLESLFQPGARAWLVGPLFLAAGDDMSELEEPDPQGCLPWLDERMGQPGSVVYASFGTHTRIPDGLLDEIAHGLVQSGLPFLWAIWSDTWTPPVDVGPNSRIVRGWVPQRSIMAHPAVGGCVSHCGWNSVIESLAAGKPVLAWPMMAEQMLNARHIVSFVGNGIKMDVKPSAEMTTITGRMEVEEKVKKLMDADSEVGKRMRSRATWAQQAIKLATSDKGTSRITLQKLVEELQTTYDIAISKGPKSE